MRFGNGGGGSASVAVVVILVCYHFTLLLFVSGFSFPFHVGNNNNNNKPPPPPSNRGDNFHSFDDDDDGDDHKHNSNNNNNPLALLLSSSSVVVSSSDNSIKSKNTATPPTTSADQVTSGAKNLWKRTIQYWQDACSSLVSRRRGTRPPSEEEQQQQQLAQVTITSITAPNSTLLSEASLRYAGQRANLLGRVLSTSGVQQVAEILAQESYRRGGYPLCRVTGATLTLDGECRLQTEEPRLHEEPVAVAFAKEMVVLSEKDGVVGNTTMSFRKYRDRQKRRRAVGTTKKEDLNTTFVQTTGRTRPSAIATAMELKQGDVFKWDPSRWNTVSRSGIWDKVLHTEPVRLSDGTVQVRIICQESAPRRVEYGISKSLYTGEWEGELDLENRNLLGGGEVLSVSVRRGTKDPEPSVLLKFKDDKFGLQKTGYAVEAFQDYIGTTTTTTSSNDDSNDNSDDNPLLTRRGVTVRSNTCRPLAFLFERSSASASVERVKTVTGGQEDVGSTTWNLGPVVRQIGTTTTTTTNPPRQSLLTTLTTGLRVVAGDGPRPYTAGTLLARHVLPLRSTAALAFRHAVTTSSVHLPRHEANAQGIAAKVRGYTQDGAVASAVGGTSELRLPVDGGRRLGTGNVVLFADYYLCSGPSLGSWSREKNDDVAAAAFTTDDTTVRGGAFSMSSSSSFVRKASIGIGLRKNIQGIPVKCDFSITQEGKIGSNLSMGRDFDVG